MRISHTGIYILFVFIIISTIFIHAEGHFDYQGYSKYLSDKAYLRFRTEPVSATFMFLSGLFGSADILYISGPVVYCFAIYKLFTTKSIKFFSALLLVLNPITVVMFLVPRNMIAIGMFTLLLSTQYRHRKLIYLVLAFLSHNLSGLASLFSLFYVKSRFAWRVIFVAICFIIIDYMLSGFFEGMRMNYKEVVDGSTGERRGLLRLMFFILFSVFFMAISVFYGKKSNFIDASLLIIFSFWLLWITPYANRLVSILILAFLTNIAISQREQFEAVSKVFLGPCVMMFVYGVYYGKWGY